MSYKVVKLILIGLIVLVFSFPPKLSTQAQAPVCDDGSCDFPEVSVKTEPFEIACPQDCGCNNNGICEAERGENYWNCSEDEVPAVTNDDCPTADSVDCLCQDLPQHLGGKSLVPCGRRSDDLDTDDICECCPCTLCHTFVLAKRITDFGVKQLLPALLVLMIVVTGVLHLIGGLSTSIITQARGVIRIIVIGAVIVFASWVIINTTLYALTGKQTGTGVAKIFANPWNEIDCDVGMSCTTAACGDGIVQKPNWDKVDEKCEIEERWEGFKARAAALGDSEDVDRTVGSNPIPGTTLVDENDYFSSKCMCEDCILGFFSPEVCCGNGKLDFGEECDKSVSEANYIASPYATDYASPAGVDSVDYNTMVNACGANCEFICPPTDPNFANIDEGCYDPEGTNPCQKGKYICDTNSTSPTYKTVVCHNVYNDPASSDFIGEDIFDYCCDDYDPTTAPIPTASILAKVQKIAPSGGGKKCDETCREEGGICIGIGKYASMTCERTTCHNTSGSACPGGQCRSWGNKGMCKDVFTGAVSCPDGSDPPDSCDNIIFVGGSNCYCYIP